MPTYEGAPQSPPRTHGTPSGYVNIRVLVPRELHFRLLSYASQSHLSLPAFVIAWLHRATPLEPPSPTGRQPSKEPAPGPRPCRDLPEAHSLAVGPGAAQEQREPAPGDRPARGPLDVSSEAVGPSAALSQKATALSSLDQNPDPASSGSSPTFDPVESSSGLDSDRAQADRT